MTKIDIDKYQLSLLHKKMANLVTKLLCLSFYKLYIWASLLSKLDFITTDTNNENQCHTPYELINNIKIK